MAILPPLIASASLGETLPGVTMPRAARSTVLGAALGCASWSISPTMRCSRFSFSSSSALRHHLLSVRNFSCMCRTCMSGIQPHQSVCQLEEGHEPCHAGRDQFLSSIQGVLSAALCCASWFISPTMRYSCSSFTLGFALYNSTQTIAAVWHCYCCSAWPWYISNPVWRYPDWVPVHTATMHSSPPAVPCNAHLNPV